MESEGVLFPVVEAHVEYRGKAGYDDLLKITSVASMVGRVRARFDAQIEHAETGAAVCRGYTIHAVTDAQGKPIRPPRWLAPLIER